MAPASKRQYDLVIFGATGFTGGLAAKYAAKQYGTSISWAVGGRSKAKLDKLAADLGGVPGVVVADSSDEAALAAMCLTTTVVATTAGPFARYGSKLVAACAESGTAYCDITGEADWVRMMIAEYDDRARETGARIVHLCGHDCLPWDILTMKLAEKLAALPTKEEMRKVDIYDSIHSAPSGGTLDTAFGIMFGGDAKLTKDNAAVKSLGFDPLLKTEAGEKSKNATQNKNVTTISSDGKQPRCLFFMAGVNANCVKRSNALNNYGEKVAYREGEAFGSILGAFMRLSLYICLGIALVIPPVRWYIQKYYLPPGTGPSEKIQEEGYLYLTGVATGTNGTTVEAEMKFFKDPGYRDTARMLVEAALSLSLDGDKCKRQTGGVYTPASCQGDAVLDRLCATGTTFEFTKES